MVPGSCRIRLRPKMAARQKTRLVIAICSRWFKLPASEHFHHGDDRRPENSDEQRGQDEQYKRDHDLDRDLLRRLFGTLTLLDPDLTRLHPENLTDGDAEGVRLHHGGGEAPQVRHRASLAEGTQRAGAAETDLLLLRARGNLAANGPLGVAGALDSAASKPRPAST